MIGVGITALLALVACGSGDDDAAAVGSDLPAIGAEIGDRLPAIDLVPLAAGDPVSLADIEGPAVVNLWATWCAPCRREIPDFEAVHQRRGDQVRFVGINIGEDADIASEFVTAVGASYDQYRDPEGYVVTELRTSAMPVTIVIDADGTITARNLGPMDQGDLNEAIDGALAVTAPD